MALKHTFFPKVKKFLFPGVLNGEGQALSGGSTLPISLTLSKRSFWVRLGEFADNFHKVIFENQGILRASFNWPIRDEVQLSMETREQTEWWHLIQSMTLLQPLRSILSGPHLPGWNALSVYLAVPREAEWSWWRMWGKQNGVERRTGHCLVSRTSPLWCYLTHQWLAFLAFTLLIFRMAELTMPASVLSLEDRLR